MKGQSSEEKQVYPARDDRDNPIEGAATGSTGTAQDPVPTADPDSRRPPFPGPIGGKGPKHD